MYKFYEKMWIYVITASICMTPYALHMTSHPLSLTSCILYLCNHTHSFNDIKATLYIISHRVYMWHSIHYIYDIISTMYDNTTLCVVDSTLGICMTCFALQLISHPLYHTKPQYSWCHIDFRHDITPTESDTGPTVSLSSQPLHWYHTHFCMKSYPLYAWHHMHSIQHHINSLCHHTTLLMTSQPLYMNQHPVWRAIYTLYMWHHSH